MVSISAFLVASESLLSQWQVEPVRPNTVTAMRWPLAELFLRSLRPVARVESERSLATGPCGLYSSWVSAWKRRPHRERTKWEFCPVLPPSATPQAIRSAVTSDARMRPRHCGVSVCVICMPFAFLSSSGWLLFLCLKTLLQINSLQSRTLRDVIGHYHLSPGDLGGSRNVVLS